MVKNKYSPSTGGAVAVLRRGLRESPELWRGMVWLVLMALLTAAGRLAIPVLLQQILDHGFDGPPGVRDGFRPGFVEGLCALAAAAVVLVYLGSRETYRRVVRNSEQALYRLRVRVFAHIHELSIAEQTAERRGAFLSRVTNDVDTLMQFTEWGAVNWIAGVVTMAATFAVMLAYSWQLALVTAVAAGPLLLVLRWLQKGLLSAYDAVRTRVGETLAEFAESVMGAAVIRAYGLQTRTGRRLGDAIDAQYAAERRTLPYSAVLFPAVDLFGALARVAVFATGIVFRDAWGLSAGDLVAFLFLVALFLEPMNELSETFEQTQTAVAGWRKVLGVLDLPVGVPEPARGRPLPAGALAVRAEGVGYAYDDGRPVLVGVDLDVPAGTHVAVVGETGSGKTTLAKLLARLADPDTGRIEVGGVDLREVDPAARRAAVRLVPQDGFLFATTVRDNVRAGRPGATDADVAAAFDALGLGGWVSGLPDGLDTQVGQRGEQLSVGERQLVALARAELAAPGLLILDEATSSVDPEAERALGEAMRRLAQGRTTVTIAHRLSTAEAADLVAVFDHGRIVERGTHADLVERGGVYAALHASWVGNTRSAA